MKKQTLMMFVLSALIGGLFYLGGYVLMVGLGVIGLTSIIFFSFWLGAKWSHKLMSEGARLAIEATNSNDRNDATKIKALADLTREAIKAHNKALPNSQGFPPLPPSGFSEGSFVIEGLEDGE